MPLSGKVTVGILRKKTNKRDKRKAEEVLHLARGAGASALRLFKVQGSVFKVNTGSVEIVQAVQFLTSVQIGNFSKVKRFNDNKSLSIPFATDPSLRYRGEYLSS